jgi:pPIWI_RE three-gene island domain Y
MQSTLDETVLDRDHVLDGLLIPEEHQLSHIRPIYLIAKGLIEYVDRVHAGTLYGYPLELRIGFEELRLACTNAKKKGPSDMLDLVLNWCSRPLIQWPLLSSFDQLFADHALLSNDLQELTPTETCIFWAEQEDPLQYVLIP